MLDVEIAPQFTYRLRALANCPRHKLAYGGGPWQPWDAILQAAQAHAGTRAPSDTRIMVELVNERIFHRY